MIQDLKLEEQQLADDYHAWNMFYNYELQCFYVRKLSQQCYRFNINFPRNINFNSLYTDKFVLTNSSNRATITRNIKDTHWVEDTYYQISRYIYNNDINDDEMIQYLIDNGRSKSKPFAMQWIVGAIEATTGEEIKNCMQHINNIKWTEENW
jgi:hypothetical protein